jgi:NAD-dependent deacetylase
VLKKVVVLSGSGISAPSGVDTFRTAGGLWSKYSIEEVATPQAFARDPKKVLEFYNMRRAQLEDVHPNKGHTCLAELEEKAEVAIITQNVDDLHERAGSSNVIHLHGELRKVRSSGNPGYIKDIGHKAVHVGDTCPEGHQLRPHIVWFGEVPMRFDEAERITSKADILIVVGTSLNVYPAASLAFLAPDNAKKYYIDPEPVNAPPDFEVIAESADIGLPLAVTKIISVNQC